MLCEALPPVPDNNLGSEERDYLYDVCGKAVAARQDELRAQLAAVFDAGAFDGRIGR